MADPRGLAHHPYLAFTARTPVTLVRDPIDRSYLETLAIDCYGTKRPEQSYSAIVTNKWTHLFTSVADVGRFTRLRKNHSRSEEEQLRHPYIFELTQANRRCYLRNGTNQTLTVHATINNETGLLDKAEISRGEVDVSRRYLRAPKWLAADIEQQSLDNTLATESFSKPSGVKFLSVGEAHLLTRATNTRNIDEALLLLNLLPSIAVGTALHDQSVPGIYSHIGRERTAFSDHKIGPVATTGITAGVRRFVHRANHLQLDRVLRNDDIVEITTYREIIKAMDFWRRAA